MEKKFSDYDWEEIRDALNDYADHLKDTEPHAVNSITALRRGADACPSNEDFE